jgi:asparagine synthase (glutamine-hydrolysing)
MSIQFGKCNFDGTPVDHKDLDQVRPLIAAYGPDGEGRVCDDNFGMLFRAFYTTKKARSEMQPYISESGSVVCWDGRLDNREELLRRLNLVSIDCADVEIVARAYEQWSTRSLAYLVGDWALSIWDRADRSVILAKDFLGTRHLYYTVEEQRVTWCTTLDPLVLLGGHSFQLDEEYVAGWLSFFPATNLTPYIGIHSVPPSSFVRLARGTQSIVKYWDFAPTKTVHHNTDAEYEEHFRLVFSESVRRRLRSDTPVLAELSGGMDSSSIVCMADLLLSGEEASTSRLDTVSYYDDSEPNWNERPYFTRVEEMRGSPGFHIDVSSQTPSQPMRDNCQIAICPGSQSSTGEAATQFAVCMAQNGNRVLLSGIGGDEVTGGVPTAIPELANSIARVRLRALARQLKVWALSKRRPWIQLLWDSVRCFLPVALADGGEYMRPSPWLQTGFMRRHRLALTGYPQRMKLIGALPSFQSNMRTLEALRRQLSCGEPLLQPLHERRFPYLDRDLLEFLFALPPEQLVRPHQRRYLMRRALVGIVPDEILNRRRKAYLIRSPLTAVLSTWGELLNSNLRMISDAFGIIDANKFAQSVMQARSSSNPPVVALQRTIALDLWLADLVRRGVLFGKEHGERVISGRATEKPHSHSMSTSFLSAENNQKRKEVTNHEVLET